MWILVQVVKGSKHFEVDTRVANHVLICDSSDLVISARSTGDASYRFEARKGNENFIIAEYAGATLKTSMLDEFIALGQRLGAVSGVAHPA